MKNESKRIKIFIGNQANIDFLDEFLAKTKVEFDIIIDDGGHRMKQQKTSFTTLFPTLKPNGMYVIEDLHTSYWPSYGGRLRQPQTTIEYLKGLVDNLNYKWHKLLGPMPEEAQKATNTASDEPVDYWDQNIKFLHFYSGICFIGKSPHNR